MPRSDPEIQHKHVETKRQLWKTVLLGEPKWSEKGWQIS
jgi:hypothetical protein